VCHSSISMGMSMMRTRSWSHWDRKVFEDGGGKGREKGQLHSGEG